MKTLRTLLSAAICASFLGLHSCACDKYEDGSETTVYAGFYDRQSGKKIKTPSWLRIEEGYTRKRIERLDSMPLNVLAKKTLFIFYNDSLHTKDSVLISDYIASVSLVGQCGYQFEVDSGKVILSTLDSARFTGFRSISIFLPL